MGRLHKLSKQTWEPSECLLGSDSLYESTAISCAHFFCQITHLHSFVHLNFVVNQTSIGLEADVLVEQLKTKSKDDKLVHDMHVMHPYDTSGKRKSGLGECPCVDVLHTRPASHAHI